MAVVVSHDLIAAVNYYSLKYLMMLVDLQCLVMEFVTAGVMTLVSKGLASTRLGMRVLDAAESVGLAVAERPLHRDEPFEELYCSSTLKELAPVATLDGQPVGGGPLGAALHEAFRGLVAREAGG